MLLKVACSGCGNPLVDFEEGKRPGAVLVHSHGFVLNPAKLPETGIAKCPKCGTETEFDGRYMPSPKK